MKVRNTLTLERRRLFSRGVKPCYASTSRRLCSAGRAVKMSTWETSVWTIDSSRVCLSSEHHSARRHRDMPSELLILIHTSRIHSSLAPPPFPSQEPLRRSSYHHPLSISDSIATATSTLWSLSNRSSGPVSIYLGLLHAYQLLPLLAQNQSLPQNIARHDRYWGCYYCECDPGHALIAIVDWEGRRGK